MSSGAKGGASRVSISSGVKKTIEDIKEITGQNHTEYEIYAMLKECYMDPNEATQRLLQLDAFHEVKRKRDKRKVVQNLNRVPTESKWKQGNQPRASRVGCGDHLSRYTPHDFASGRNSAVVKENSNRQHSDKSICKAHSVAPHDVKSCANYLVASPTPANGSSDTASVGTNDNQFTKTASKSKSEAPFPCPSTTKSIKNHNSQATDDAEQLKMMEFSITPAPIPSAPSSGFYSTSDPVLLSSQDSPLPTSVASNHGDVGSEHATAELIGENSMVGKLSSTELLGPEKEWKLKSMNINNDQAATTATEEVSAIPIGNHPEPHSAPTVLTSKEDKLEVQTKLQELNLSDRQHVIIPDHLYVPEVEKLGFCFGSFDASFGLDMDLNQVPASDDSSPLSESSEATDEPVKEQQLCSPSLLVTVEDSEERYHDQPQSPSQGTEKVASNDVVVASSISPDYSESKPEVSPRIQEHLVVHSSSNYNLGFLPQMLGGQLPSLESSDSHACDPSRHPGLVPQSFDPASYYAQFYRSGLVNDGQMSGAANKYNGNTTLVSTQTSQDGAIPVVLSTASPPPLVTQAAGVMLSSANQHLLPVFRQPTGVHLQHYPPNFIPYGPYFSPFYVPPPTFHQFLSNGGFPQQPQAGNLYTTPPETAAKNSLPQYKQGSNTGISHVGVPGNYGMYGLSMPHYTSPSIAVTSSEDIYAPKIKENNAYVSSQQSDGSGVWFNTLGRDISNLQASSFYNLPQGQLSFAPTQPVHGAFTGILHPAQPMTTPNGHPFLQQAQATTNAPNMVGPTASVHQQPQLNY